MLMYKGTVADFILLRKRNIRCLQERDAASHAGITERPGYKDEELPKYQAFGA